MIMKGRIGTPTNIRVRLSKNDLRRKKQMKEKRMNHEAKVALSKELRETPKTSHLDVILENKKRRELNKKTNQ